MLSRILNTTGYLPKGLACVLLLVMVPSAPVWAEALLPWFKPFPRSTTLFDRHTNAPDYRFVYSSLQRVNGRLLIESSTRISGRLHQQTWETPDDHSSEQVFQQARAQLQEKGFKTLFECAGRACGNSNLWANNHFGIARLFGPDDGQFFLSGVLNQGEQQVAVSLYSIRRGNGRVYLHLEALELDEASRDQTLFAQHAGWFKQFVTGKRAYITPDRLEGLTSSGEARELVAWLALNPDATVYLVGHQYTPSETLDRQLSQATVVAENVRAALIEAGANESQLTVFGVGPLAPAYDADLPKDRVEVVYWP